MEASGSSEERTWGMIAHLSALAGFVVPLGNVLGPLIVWMIKRETMPLVEDQGKEALNFQLCVTIILVVSIILSFIAIGLPILVIAGLYALVMTIVAGVKANSGERYRYPITFRFIK